MKSITIIGRKWHDRQNGNTYCTAQVIVDGGTVGKTEFQYGYSDHYVGLATQWLEKNGYIELEHYDNGGHEMLWRYCEKNNIKYLAESFNCLKREC